MTGTEAVTLLVKRFPVVKDRVDDPNDLFETPHVTYGLLATEVLENVQDQGLFKDLCKFIDELANSGDDLLEELLVIDVLEGLAQNPELAARVGSCVSPKALEFLTKVEREFFRRHP